MSDNNFNVHISGADSDAQYVQVPIKKKDFGDFITNLLGQPETIVGTRRGEFEVTYEWLVHVHHLLDQRIKQQASCALVDFSARFDYSSGPNRKITTIDGFLSFNEAKIVFTKGVELTWTYLVNFPGKVVPEKQEISLKLMTDKAVSFTVGSSSLSQEVSNSTGVVRFVVSHTERTWGDDISSLLEREVETLFKPEKLVSKIVAYAINFLALGMLAVGIFVPDYIEHLIREKETARIFLSVVPVGGSVDGLSVDDKLNLVVKLLDPNNQLHMVAAWYRGASFLVGVGLAVVTKIIFSQSASSFILITNSDKERKLSCEKNQRYALVKSSLSYLLAIAAGVLGNYAYYYLNL